MTTRAGKAEKTPRWLVAFRSARLRRRRKRLKDTEHLIDRILGARVPVAEVPYHLRHEGAYQDWE